MINGMFIYFISLLLAKKTRIAETSAIKSLIRNSMGIYLFHDPLNPIFLLISYETGWLSQTWWCRLMWPLRTIGIFSISLVLAIILGKIKTIFNQKMAEHTA
jgi:hypothetical protein